MNIKQKIWGGFITTIGWFPSVSLAEVSDKIPSILSVLITGLLVGVVLFFIARFRWWLGVLLSPIPMVLVAESFSLWNEKAMQEAILIEQGWVYFGVLGMQGIFVLTGAVTGIIFGYIAVKGRNQ